MNDQDAGDFLLRDAADLADLFDPELAATLRDMAAEYAGPYIEKETTPMSDETRVLLVKPGDMLLIGNVGHVGDPNRASAAVQVFEDMGIRVVFFMADIEMQKVPHD